MTVVPMEPGGAELVRHGGPSPALIRAGLAERWQFAETLATAGLLPASYRKNPGNLLLALELSEALGIHHMTAINGVHVVEGRPTLSAELMRALILRDGHTFIVEEFSTEKVTVAVARRERPGVLQRFTYTIADAQRAKLTNKAIWQHHPGPMLLARVSSTAGRAVFPDVLAGMGYTAEELDAPVDLSGEPLPEGSGPAPAAAAIMSAPADRPADNDRSWVDETHAEILAAPSTEVLNGLAQTIANAEGTGLDPEAVAYLRRAMADRAADLPAGQRALRRMHTALSALGMDDAQRRQAAGNVAGRVLTSTSELTGAEADAVWRRAGAAMQEGGRASLLYPDGEDPAAPPADEDDFVDQRSPEEILAAAGGGGDA